MSDSDKAEDIVDSLMTMSCVDNYELVLYAFGQLSEKDRDKFVEFIMETWELMTFDQAMEAAADAKSI